jgi:ssDNA-binding Zn-finger/Zn-ribbon topoisomerase 1
MPDDPKCKECGATRVAMQTSRGGWFLGCPTCKGKPKVKPPKPDDEPKPKPAPKPKEKGHWLDDWL